MAVPSRRLRHPSEDARSSREAQAHDIQSARPKVRRPVAVTLRALGRLTGWSTLRAILVLSRSRADKRSVSPRLPSILLRTQSDAHLVLLAAEGSEVAFEALVERYRRPLERKCRRMLGGEDVDDAVQLVFLRVWSSLRSGGEVRELRPWLFRIAHNTAIDVLRTSRYDYEELRESLRGADGPDADIERAAVIRKTLAGLAELPEAQREALVRVALDGDSRAKVASDLGLTEGAVRQLVYRARVRLRGVATAITPLPLVSWAAVAQGGAPVGERIAQIAAAGAPAGLPMVVKTGAILATAATIAVTPVAMHRSAEPRPSQSHASKKTTPGGGRLSAVGLRAPSVVMAAKDRSGGSPAQEDEGRSGRHGDASGQSEAAGHSGASGRSPGSGDGGASMQAGRQEVDRSGDQRSADEPGGGQESGPSGAVGRSGQSDDQLGGREPGPGSAEGVPGQPAGADGESAGR